MLMLRDQVMACAIALAIHPTTLIARADRQSYQVHVPTRASVQAPPVAASARLPEGAGQVRLPEQNWSVASNSQSGATVRLVADHSFQNLEDPSICRDAGMDLRIITQSCSGNWIGTRPRASTDHEAAGGTTFVEAQSSKPGSAAIGLVVTFEQTDSAFTPAGCYELTVTGTIVAN